jgi:MFS transporter, MHS family, proline/betaine transporter
MKSLKKVLISGMLGNALEWYDFALYGHFVAIISSLYFPNTDPYMSLIATFGAFAAGFFMRPIGAIVFGYIGDRFGRKQALVSSILLMAIPTGCIGLLPTYEQIGVAAPILLTIIRLLQGLSLGGAMSGSISFLVEHAPENRKGFAGSTVMFSMNIGILLGSAAAAACSHFLSAEDFMSWGWRIPFLFGFCAGLIGIYIKKEVEESPDYLEAKKKKQIAEQPAREIFTTHRSNLLTGISLYLTVTIPFFIFAIFFNNYMSKILGYSISNSLTINTLSTLLMTILIPIVGYYSDIYGRVNMVKIGAIGFILFSYPAFMLISQGGFAAPLIGQMIFAVLIALYMSPIPTMLVELFPASVRFTGVALSYNISAALFGGTAPMVSTLLIKQTGMHESVPIYIMIFAVISFIRINKVYKKNKTCFTAA